MNTQHADNTQITRKRVPNAPPTRNTQTAPYGGGAVRVRVVRFGEGRREHATRNL